MKRIISSMLFLITAITVGQEITNANKLHINGSGGVPSTTNLNSKAGFKLSSATGGLGTQTSLFAGVGGSEYTWLQSYNTSGGGLPKDIVLNALGGKVGIGTATMGKHKLAVEGSIGAREIKVEATPNWSDFVFEEKYKLPTLVDVEKHIEEKGHLKDIPSAKEVAKEGFYLGEMNAKLLQKIEELTLYTIQQEKKIQLQDESFKKMEKELELIKKLLKKK